LRHNISFFNVSDLCNNLNAETRLKRLYIGDRKTLKTWQGDDDPPTTSFTLFSPNVVWALVPAVSAALIKAAPTLYSVECLQP